MNSDIEKELCMLREENAKLVNELNEFHKKQEQFDKFKSNISYWLKNCSEALMTHTLAYISLLSMRTDDEPDNKKILEYIKKHNDEDIVRIISASMTTMDASDSFIKDIGKFLYEYL